MAQVVHEMWRLQDLTLTACCDLDVCPPESHQVISKGHWLFRHFYQNCPYSTDVQTLMTLALAVPELSLEAHKFKWVAWPWPRPFHGWSCHQYAGTWYSL